MGSIKLQTLILILPWRKLNKQALSFTVQYLVTAIKKDDEKATKDDVNKGEGTNFKLSKSICVSQESIRP